MQWPCSAIPAAQPLVPKGCLACLSPPALFSDSVVDHTEHLCSHPAVGEGAVAVFNQHRLDDLGVCDSQHGLSAIVNPGGGRRGGR